MLRLPCNAPQLEGKDDAANEQQAKHRQQRENRDWIHGAPLCVVMRTRTDQRQYKAETSRVPERDNEERCERLEVEAFGSTIALDREGSGAR